MRAYNLIYNEWFRDENLINSASVATGDGPDANGSYILRRRGKRHDYFTSCLPWPQKGPAVPLPLGTSAPLVGTIPGYPNRDLQIRSGPLGTGSVRNFAIGGAAYGYPYVQGSASPDTGTPYIFSPGYTPDLSGVTVDLSAATAATINVIRQSFQIQKLLERDARGGTRYTELLRAHFGVMSPDARLQRPEYLGGGHTPVIINPISQTSATTISGGDTPLGTLGAMGTAFGSAHGFRQSFTEHGMIIGLINVRADLTYQQGIRVCGGR